jgi:hypothetical protein
VEREDGLQFKPYVTTLASAVRSNNGPLTIGIYGPWGSGKTTLMSMIRAQLTREPLRNDTQDPLITTWFNAWKYEQDDNPTLPLISNIISALENEKTFTHFTKPVITTLRTIVSGFVLKGKLNAPVVGDVGVEFDGRKLLEEVDKRRDATLKITSSYHEAFNSLNTLSIKSKIVVFIDDLDRCLPNNALKLLEAIKLILSQQGFIFILGLDHTTLLNFLDMKYREEYGIDNSNATHYLDKIVQRQFEIPPHTNRMAKLCSILRQESDDIDADDIAVLTKILPLATEENPRSTIKFLNGLLLDKFIHDELPHSERIGLPFFGMHRLIQNEFLAFFTLVAKHRSVAQPLRVYIKNGAENEQKLEDIASEAQLMQFDEKRFREAVQLLEQQSDLLQLMASTLGLFWLENHNHRELCIDFYITHRGSAKASLPVSMRAEGNSSSAGAICRVLVFSKPDQSSVRFARLLEKQFKLGDVRFARELESGMELLQNWFPDKFIGGSILVICLNLADIRHHASAIIRYTQNLLMDSGRIIPNPTIPYVIIYSTDQSLFPHVEDVYTRFQDSDFEKVCRLYKLDLSNKDDIDAAVEFFSDQILVELDALRSILLSEGSV